jgi:hypothetical protein
MACEDSPVTLFCGGRRLGAGLELRGVGRGRVGGDAKGSDWRGVLLELARAGLCCCPLFLVWPSNKVPSTGLGPLPRDKARASRAAALAMLGVRIQAGVSVSWNSSWLSFSYSFDMLQHLNFGRFGRGPIFLTEMDQV